MEQNKGLNENLCQIIENECEVKEKLEKKFDYSQPQLRVFNFFVWNSIISLNNARLYTEWFSYSVLLLVFNIWLWQSVIGIFDTPK